MVEYYTIFNSMHNRCFSQFWSQKSKIEESAGILSFWRPWRRICFFDFFQFLEATCIPWFLAPSLNYFKLLLSSIAISPTPHSDSLASF